MPKLQEARVTNPEEISELPHFTSIRCLTFSGYLTICDDWQWMRDVEHLEELDLKIGEMSESSATDADRSIGVTGSISVHEQKIQIEIHDSEVTTLSRRILENLPSYWKKAVRLYIKL